VWRCGDSSEKPISLFSPVAVEMSFCTLTFASCYAQAYGANNANQTVVPHIYVPNPPSHYHNTGANRVLVIHVSRDSDHQPPPPPPRVFGATPDMRRGDYVKNEYMNR
jgi:hypothetical protein